MASSDVNLELTFINLTDNPAEGRDARRIRVRQVVMSDYHKRRRRSKRQQQICHEQQTQNGKSSLGSDSAKIGAAQSTSERYSLDKSSPSPLLTKLEPRSTALFRPKTWASSRMSFTGSLIINFFRGQIIKATQDMSYVSFVHRQFRDTAQRVDLGQNPLNICEQILRKFEDGPSSTEKLEKLWEAVHREQERIYAKCDEFGKWELLSAAQAVTLYILLWLRMGPPDSTFSCGNLALLFTLGKVFMVLRMRYLHFDPSDTSLPLVGDWQSWIYRESCLRTANVYFILSVVLAMNLGLDCDWTVEEMPLPATKASWEASNDANWKTSVGRHESEQSPSFGDFFNPQRHPENPWEETLDEMGLICAMTCRLVQDILTEECAKAV